MKLTIHVKENHIERGDPNSCTNDAISLAIIDRYPNFEIVSVDSNIILQDEDGNQYITKFMLDDDITKFIDSGQMGEGVKPFSFDVEFVRVKDYR